MAGLPQFTISTQQDPYWEIPFFDAAGTPLSVDGREFEAWVTPAVSGSGIAQPPSVIKVLKFGDGLTLVPPTDGSGDQSIKNTFVHQMTREFAQANMPRGDLTADILEVVDGRRRLLVPVRLRYDDPAAIRDFIADRAGVSFGAGRQPIITPVAVAGQVGARGTGFLTGEGPPTTGDGDEGDYWIDSAAEVRTLYGPKMDGAWPADGKPITSEITPELQAARDAAVSAAESTAGHAQTTQADRQAVETATAQVEVSRQVVTGAQAAVSADRAVSLGARTDALAARDTAAASDQSADAQRVAAQSAAADVRQYAAIVGAAAFDFNFDSAPTSSNDWNA